MEFVAELSDQAWLEANLNPALGRQQTGIAIPDLPPEDVQMRFTARHGRDNLQQAFDFYKMVLDHLPVERKGQFRLIDFGGGWGRVLRLFLRETPAEELLLVDCMTDAVECARGLHPPFSVLQNAPAPPLPSDITSADCCYAFSVFSHLSEAAFRAWLRCFSDVLVPGGKLIFTTRGTRQIQYLKQLAPDAPMRLRLPHPDKILRRYRAGDFQFYRTGGGGELTDDFYGEAWIPRLWMERNSASLGFGRCEFLEEFESVDQCVFILTKSSVPTGLG